MGKLLQKHICRKKDLIKNWNCVGHFWVFQWLFLSSSAHKNKKYMKENGNSVNQEDNDDRILWDAALSRNSSKKLIKSAE